MRHASPLGRPGGLRDQAAGLRRLFARRGARCVPVAGCAHGSTTANLAAAAALTGFEVVIVDGTRGEVARALGLSVRLELAHVLAGDRRLDQVLLPAADGVRVAPAARGLAQLARSNGSLAGLLGRARPAPDLIIVHRPDPEAWRGLPEAAAPPLVVAAADAGDVSEAYAALRRSLAGAPLARLLVEPGDNELDALTVYGKIALAARRFLRAYVAFAGFVPDDQALRAARRAARPVFDIDPRAASAQGFVRAAGLLLAGADIRSQVEAH